MSSRFIATDRYLRAKKRRATPFLTDAAITIHVMSEGQTKSRPKVVKASRYCRKCSYVLDGLASSKCPECGRGFDPGNRRTFRRRPRLRWWGWAWRFGAVGALLLAIAAGWLYRVHSIEQAAMEWADDDVFGFYDTAPYGPAWLTDWLTDRDLPRIDTVIAMDLSDTEVTDAEMVYLQDLRNLQWLDLSFTQVTDAGLVHLKELNTLQWLYLAGKHVTDAGLIHLKGLTNLQELDLEDAPVKDSGLVHLKELRNLRHLNLCNTQVTDAGLVHLQEMSSLQELALAGTQITDAGLVHLYGLSHLETLHLGETQVTDAGVVELQKALPNLQIVR